MKYVAYGLMAAFLAAAVYGAIPDTAAGWYMPDKFSIEVTSGVLEVQTTDEYGNTDTIEYPVYVDETGYVVGMDGTDLTDDVLNSVSYKALQAFVLAVRNKERIETIGENLNDLTSKTGIHITNESTGQEFTIKFGGSIATAVSESSGEIPATSDAEDPADGSSLSWRNDGKLQISAWDTTPSAGDTLANKLTSGTGYVNDPSRSLALVTRTASGNLRYLAIGVLSSMMTVDGKSIETNETDGAISLYGWESSGGVESLADFLTINEGAAGGDMPTYEVLARCTDGEDTSLAYLSLGNLYGVTWATNWTEAVEHITKEETIKIVSWTTNWVNYTENVTNYYDVVNWITNWVEHSLFVTNYEDVVNVVTNMVYHENFITNMLYHENFITNMFYHENFITNTWNHENFVTNMFYRENFITNVINHEDFVTNVIEVYSSITNFENFVNFQTNMFYNEVFITNVIDKYSAISNFENFVTFQTNTFENLRTIENWTYITNYIVRYLGGGGSGDPGGDDYGPAIAPEDDPYSVEYEPQEIDEDLLPVKNARMLVAITNAPFSRIDARGMLDFMSVDTNGSSRAQVFGFAQAPENAIPIKRGRDGGPVLEWVDFPTNLVSITTNEIEEIRKWMRTKNINNIFNTTVTNAEKFAEMRTNFFSQVVADTLLDGESVWTNGNRRVEVKGYRNAAAYTVPYLDVTQATVESGRDKDLVWERLPFADSDANTRFGVIDAPFSISAVESGTPDSDYTFKMLSLYGFGDASDGQVPVKQTQNGHETLTWTNLQGAAYSAGSGIQIAGASTNVIEHNFIAGAGISLTPGTNGTAVVIATTTPSAPTVVDPHLQEITYLTEIWYDNIEHTIKAKRQTAKLMVVGTVSEAETFEVVVCTPHSDEHQSGQSE